MNYKHHYLKPRLTLLFAISLCFTVALSGCSQLPFFRKDSGLQSQDSQSVTSQSQISQTESQETETISEETHKAGESGAIQEKEIKLIADRKDIKLKNGGILPGEGGDFLLPVSCLADAFTCAENFYENSRLVIEKGDLTLELKVDSTIMKAGDREIELSNPLQFRDDILYIPAQAIKDGFSYSFMWQEENRTLAMWWLSPDSGELPPAYDYRKIERAPQVKNQGGLGTCWAFASLMALETTMLPEERLDLSEDHMSLNNGFSLSQEEGGEYTMSMAYLLSWRGPVLEEQDPYGDGYSPEGLRPVKHIQEIQILPSKDYRAIKEAVYLYGGVQSSLFTSLKSYESRSEYYNETNNAYCYTGEEKPNHDSVIIGWDDNYPKENFNMDVEGNGAFVCINSWGEQFGDNGFFYVSYYDSNIGVNNILYTSIQPPDNYDHIYQSDLRGWVGQMGYGKDTAYFANVFESRGREALSAAGFYATGPNSSYEVYLSRNAGKNGAFGQQVLVANGKLKNTGYYTVPLDQPVVLNAGERFALIVKITTPGSVHPVAIEYDADDGLTKVDLSDGEGYISNDAKNWERVEQTQNCNICLKAYTKEI